MSRYGRVPELLYGILPVITALKAKQRRLAQLFLRNDLFEDDFQKEFARTWLSQIHDLAKVEGIPVDFCPTDKLKDLTNGRPHQGVILEVGPLPIRPFTRQGFCKSLSHSRISAPENIMHWCSRKIVLLLDHLTDVMNVGNILRSASFFGTSTIILSPSPCVAPSPLISKLSAGSMECLEFYRLSHPQDDLKLLSHLGFCILGTVCAEFTENSNTIVRDLHSVIPDVRNEPIKPLVVALGSESRGLTPEVLNACDVLVRIPGSHSSSLNQYCPTPSLNVSVAAGILLYQLSQHPFGNIT